MASYIRSIHSLSSSSSNHRPFTVISPMVDEIPSPTDVSKHTQYLDLSNRGLTRIPQWLTKFTSLEKLNLSKNQIQLTERDVQILLQSSPRLKKLVLHTNSIRQVPKMLERRLFENHLVQLEYLDMSNNQIEDITPFTYCKKLTYLQLTANRIQEVPLEIQNVDQLQILYLGYNQITQVSPGMCNLPNLELLGLNNNKLRLVPASLAALSKLRTLHLHYNQIMTIPSELVRNRCDRVCRDGTLREITLRGNPLVTSFVRRRLMAGIRHKPPTLYELACRTVNLHNIPYDNTVLSERIIDHLESAHKCPNPNCSGVYFDTRYVQVKFVDCCGAYQLPLQQFLCSPNCVEDTEASSTSGGSSDSDFNEVDVANLYRRVILSGVHDRQ